MKLLFTFCTTLFCLFSYSQTEIQPPFNLKFGSTKKTTIANMKANYPKVRITDNSKDALFYDCSSSDSLKQCINIYGYKVSLDCYFFNDKLYKCEAKFENPSFGDGVNFNALLGFLIDKYGQANDITKGQYNLENVVIYKWSLNNKTIETSKTKKDGIEPTVTITYKDYSVKSDF